jgi:hypothetical protein
MKIFNMLNIISVPLFFVLILYSCNNITESDFEWYTHNFTESFLFDFETDSLEIAILLYPQYINVEDIRIQIRNDTTLSQHVRVILSVYGESYEKEPKLEKYLYWSTDSIFIWYSFIKYEEYLKDNINENSNTYYKVLTTPKIPGYQINNVIVEKPTRKFVDIYFIKTP